MHQYTLPSARSQSEAALNVVYALEALKLDLQRALDQYPALLAWVSPDWWRLRDVDRRLERARVTAVVLLDEQIHRG